jgi:hypothetical protein
MKSLILKSLVVTALTFSVAAQADDAAAPVPAPAPATAPETDTSWNGMLQRKYSLTDAQMQTLNDSKLPDSQKAQVAQLAKSSGKSIDEVLKMRTEDKMGWGKIAKTLGVHPGELGKAVSEMKKERNAARKDKDSKRDSMKHDGPGHGKPEHAGAGHGKGKNK